LRDKEIPEFVFLSFMSSEHRGKNWIAAAAVRVTKNVK
jgi:hypothetical protein